MKEFKRTIDGIELQLEEGNNTFEFKVVDLAGNETVEKVTIKKKSKKK